MKLLVMLSFCLISVASSAQTSKELIGKWKLVSVDYFDAKKRVITNDKTGTLEYEKVEN